MLHFTFALLAGKGFKKALAARRANWSVTAKVRRGRNDQNHQMTLKKKGARLRLQDGVDEAGAELVHGAAVLRQAVAGKDLLGLVLVARDAEAVAHVREVLRRHLHRLPRRAGLLEVRVRAKRPKQLARVVLVPRGERVHLGQQRARDALRRARHSQPL